MARPISTERPIGQFGDPLLRMQQQIDDLQKEVSRLSGQSRPTIPIYAPAFLDAMSDTGMNDGEYWINANNEQAYYIVNGRTYKISAT